MGNEEEIQNSIYSVLSEYEDEYGASFKSIKTNEESEILTENKGFIIKDFDDSEFQITITKIK